MFRFTARGVENSPDDKVWVESLVAQRTRWSQIRSAVRREIRFDLQDVQFTSVPTKKLEEIWHSLTGETKKMAFDEVIEMYI
jgi:hypothetical protein